MILEIKDLLTAPELAQLREIAARAKFTDGRLTNTGFDQKVNLQIDPREGDFAQSAKIVADALTRSREFRDFTFARRVAPPMLCPLRARHEVRGPCGRGFVARLAIRSACGRIFRARSSSTIPSAYEGRRAGASPGRSAGIDQSASGLGDRLSIHNLA